jgi:lysophospholipase L1-like esterase
MSYIPDPTNHTEPVESRKVVSAAAEFRALKGYVRGLEASKELHVVVIGDSMSAQQSLFGQAWPTILRDLMQTAGQPVKITSLAMSGHTFYRANTVACFNGKTQVQRAIDLQPDVVIVALGINDVVINVDERTVAEVIEDAATVVSALRAGIPNVALIWVQEKHWDTVNKTDGTDLYNAHIPPGLWNLDDFFDTESGDGVFGTELAGVYNVYKLHVAIPPALQTKYAAYAADFIPAVTGFNEQWTPDVFGIMLLGGCGADGLHLNNAGQRLLAAEMMRCARGSVFFTILSEQGFADWESVDVLKNALLHAVDDGVGTGFFFATKDEAIPTGVLAVLQQTYKELKFPYWYMPTGMYAEPYPVDGGVDTLIPTIQSGNKFVNCPIQTPLEVLVARLSGATAVTDVGYADPAGNFSNFIPGHYTLDPEMISIAFRCGNQAVVLETTFPPAEYFTTLHPGSIMELYGVTSAGFSSAPAGTVYPLPLESQSLKHSSVAVVTIAGISSGGQLAMYRQGELQLRITGSVYTLSLGVNCAFQLRVEDVTNGVTYTGPIVVNKAIEPVLATAPIDVTLRNCAEARLKLYYYGTPQLWLNAGTTGKASLIQVVSERIA